MRTDRFCWIAAMTLLVCAAALGQSAKVEKTTIPLDALDRRIEAEAFDPGFPMGDSNYNAILAVSDGAIHFSVNTHNIAYGCRYYIFDPKTERIAFEAEIDEVLGEDAATHVPQGKIHTLMYEYEGKVWFATHMSFYEGGLPGRNPGERIPYAGGHFMSYDLATGEFTDHARVLPNEGIITMAMDKANGILYGLTWPSGLLVSYDIAADALRCWGAVQDRGEWGQHPWEWDRICRQLGVAPDGKVYGSTMDGRIWRYDRAQVRPVTHIEGLDLSKATFSQSAEETNKGDFQQNWRAIRWNPETESFWGILWETTALFEFDPATDYIRAIAELRPEAYQGMPRNPEISQLGFTLGPKNTLFYLAHGPAVEIADRPPVQSSLCLLTYSIDDGKMENHGPIFTKDGRRVFFAECIAIGQDDHIYTVAWVEAIDPERRAKLAEARQSGPAETAQMVYEIQLVRLPKCKHFVR